MRCASGTRTSREALNDHPIIAIGMLRSVAVFLLAGTIAGAPVATAICQVRCADRDAHSAPVPSHSEHHSCHEVALPTGIAVTGVPHSCDHSDDSLASDQSVPVVASPPASVLAGLLIPLNPDGANDAPASTPQRPQNLLSLASQLRV